MEEDLDGRDMNGHRAGPPLEDLNGPKLIPFDKLTSAIASIYAACRCEARVGIEPTHKGFADLSLTTWVPRHLPGALDIIPTKFTQRAKYGQAQAEAHYSGANEHSMPFMEWC